jgi:hypothetical protein
MKRAFSIFASACLLGACGSDASSFAVAGEDSGADGAVAEVGDDATVADASAGSLGCGYAYDAYNASPSIKANSTVKWTCTATTRSVAGNGLPDHDVGTFPNANCPNTISAQSVSATMTLAPTQAATATVAGVGGVGYAFNGVKFDPATAGTCSDTGGGTTCSLIGNTGNWHIEALGQSSFNFGVDSNNAHVQPGGAYHYHGMPEAVLAKLAGGATKPTLVGYALDGFPVYARYGYATPSDASSAVRPMKGSYRLKAAAVSGRPSTATYPMGAFTEDYEYVAGSGDLDECNGRTGVTPEFPAGTYHYYVTDTYPFIQRCLKGKYTSTSGPPGDAGVGPMPDGAGASCASSGTCAAN